ncbi:MAG: chitobiase/beta-hexosaminidase C-terminal domain-containing protein [Treponema sp.]|jgi:hypothetical protein|nr:chitobiase/beta-hexosaminidase C-terminal domain-containing protein [Treponema sp.]
MIKGIAFFPGIRAGERRRRAARSAAWCLVLAGMPGCDAAPFWLPPLKEERPQFSKAAPPEKALPPTASPMGGVYNTAQTISLSAPSDQGAVYYTLDGSAPTQESERYTEPIAIGAPTRLKAITLQENLAPSEPLSELYEFAVPPKANIPGGTYTGTQLVTLSAPWGSQVYYTIDGADPTEASRRALGYIGISGSLTLKAVAVWWGTASQVMTETYTVIPVPGAALPFAAAPEVSPASGGEEELRCVWTPSLPPADRYELYYAAGERDAGYLLAQGTKADCGTGLAAAIPGLYPRGVYSLLVRAVKRGYEDRDSAVKTHAFVPASFNTAPALTLARGVNSLACSWAPAFPPADSYTVYYRLGAGYTAEEVMAAGVKAERSNSPYTISGLAAGQTYSAVVLAQKTGYEDRPSAPASAAVLVPVETGGSITPWGGGGGGAGFAE